jgi:hypothetical protein
MVKVRDILFGIFTIVWIVTRLGIYPAYILNSTLIEAPKIVPMFAAYYIFNSMLTILLCLHVFWTWYIVRIAFKSLTAGGVERDERSSPESLSDSSDHGSRVETQKKKTMIPLDHKNSFSSNLNVFLFYCIYFTQTSKHEAYKQSITIYAMQKKKRSNLSN